MSGKQGKWRRRLRRLAVGTVVTLLVARLLLALLMPWLVQLGAGAAGLDATYRSASLSLLGLSLRFEDLEVRVEEFPDDPPLLRAQEVVVDLAMAQLLRGNIGVVDAAIDGAHVELQRDHTGRLHLPSAWTGGAAAPAVEQPVPPSDAPVHFDLPLQIASARLHDLRLRFHDASASPPTQAELTLDADATDVGRTDRAGTIEVRLHGPQWFDDFWLQASTTTMPDRLQLTWQIHVRGMRPAGVPQLAATDSPLANLGGLSLALHGEVSGQTVAGEPRRPTLAGALKFALDLDGRERLAGEVTAGPCRNSQLGVDLPFSVHVRGNDLADDLQLLDGLVQLEPERMSLTTRLAARGVRLAPLQPWLAMAGVQLPPDGLDATANCSAVQHTVAGSGSSSLAAEITQFSLGSGDQRVDLARVAIGDLCSKGGELAVGSIEIEGPELAIVVRKDELSIAGIRFVTPPPALPPTDTPPPPSPPGAGPSEMAMPHLSLGKLDWRGLRVVFTDATLAEPATLTLADATVTAERIVLGRDEPPGRLTATCRVPDTAGELRAELTFAPSPHAVAIEAAWTASEVTAAGLKPWLQPLGVQPVLEHGHVSLVASADVAIEAGTLAANARLGKLRCTDGELVLASLRNVELRGLRIGAGERDLGALTIDEPFLAVQQPAPDVRRVLGFEFRRPPAAATVAAAAKLTAPPPEASTPPANDLPLRRGPVTLRSGVVRWTDASGQPLSLGADATLGADDGSGTPVPIEASGKLGEAIEALHVRGTVCLTPTSFRLETELEGRGLRGAPLSQLLPQHVRCTLHDGSVHASLTAELGLTRARSVHVQLQNVRLADGGEELAAIDELELQAPELSATLIHIARLELRGARAVTGTTVDGLHVPGFLLRPAAPAPTAVPAAVAADPPASTPPTKGPLVPAIRIDTIDVAVERVVWRERLQQDGEPLIATLHIALDAPWVTAEDFAETQPARFTVRASASPLCRDVHIAATVQPFDLQPTLGLELRAEGIDTTSVERLVPGLSDRLQGTVTDARLSVDVHATLGLRRRDPRQFDLTRPFGGEFVIDKAEFLAAPEGPVLASIAAIEIVARTFDPGTGDLLLRTLLIDTPRLQAHRTAAGMELLGLRLLDAPAVPAPAEPAPAASPPAARPAVEATAPVTARAPVFAIDRLQIHGLLFTYTDETTEPATDLPFEDIDLEVRRFSTRAFHEPRPITFSVAVHGGVVTLAKRDVGSAITGLVTSTVGTLTGGATPAHEERPLLDEFAIAGSMQLYPGVTGQMHCGISSFELAALRGLAKSGGVDLTDGLFDMRLDATLAADGVDVDNHATFTWLSLSEPAGGPISTYLRLPAPLNTVLFLLRNEGDEHQLPMRLHVPAEGLSSNAITRAAAESVLKVVTDAITGAGLRATGAVTSAVTGVFGLGGGPDLQALATTATFSPGDPMPQTGDLTRLLDAASDPEMRIVLTHEFGAGDLARAAELANPPPPLVADTVRRLQRERNDLSRERSALAAEVAAHFAAGQVHEARAEQDELSRLDDSLGRLEQTLDEALGLLVPNARATASRTRKAALAMAEARLRALVEQLQRRLPPGAVFERRRPRAAASADLPEGGRILISVRSGHVR